MSKTFFRLAAAALTAAFALPSASAAGTPSAGDAAIVRSANDFAFRLYGGMAAKDENIFFSPCGITAAMSMAFEGARGATAKEMAKALGLPEKDAERRSFFSRDLARLRDKLGVDMGNAFWAQSGYKFLPKYLKVLDRYYRAGAFNADFAADAEKARLEINSWTGDRTRGKITELFPADSLDSLTRLVLVNAVYFKGAWEKGFDAKLTADREFFQISGASSTVKMMKLAGEGAKFNYAEDGETQVLELPYKNPGLSMLVLLPPAGGLKKLEESLSAEKLDSWRGMLSYDRVDVFLPRFTLAARYDLQAGLSALGMPAAFTPAADFSGMNGEKTLYIQRAVHQGFVEVNEEGTEAAAATGVSMGLKSMPQPPSRFLADHPFLFLIREKEGGRILFMGRVLKP